MSPVTKRTVTHIRHEYAVPSPAPVSEVMAAIAQAQHEMPEQRRSYDDACTVEARGDEIVIWWPERPEVDQ